MRGRRMAVGRSAPVLAQRSWEAARTRAVTPLLRRGAGGSAKAVGLLAALSVRPGARRPAQAQRHKCAQRRRAQSDGHKRLNHETPRRPQRRRRQAIAAMQASYRLSRHAAPEKTSCRRVPFRDARAHPGRKVLEALRPASRPQKQTYKRRRSCSAQPVEALMPTGPTTKWSGGDRATQPGL